MIDDTTKPSLLKRTFGALTGPTTRRLLWTLWDMPAIKSYLLTVLARLGLTGSVIAVIIALVEALRFPG